MTTTATPQAGLPGLEALWTGRLGGWEPLAGALGRPGPRLWELCPGRRAVVAVPAAAGHPAASLFLFAETEAARAFFRQSLERVSGEGDVFLNREQAAVLWRHPFDPTLRALAALADPGFRADLLHRLRPDSAGDSAGDQGGSFPCRLEQWIPERRARLRVDPAPGSAHPGLQLEVLPPLDAEAAVHAHQLLAQASEQGAPFQVPRLVQSLEGRNLLVREYLPPEEAGHWCAPWAARDLGRALGRLHRSDLEPLHRPSPPEEGDAIRARAADLARLSRSLEARLRAAGDTLGERICLLNLSPSAVMLDGLRLDQVGRKDGQVVWREPARLRRGAPVLDLATLKICLEEAGAPLEECWQGYRDGGGTLPPEEWSRVAEARARFLQLEEPLLQLSADWEDVMARDLVRVESLLTGDAP